MRQPGWSRNRFLVVLAVMVATLGVPCLAQPAKPPAPEPEATDAGTFAGTWAYVSRDRNMAMWVRLDAAGLPEMKFRVQNNAMEESFETDWSGRAAYYLAGAPAKFEVLSDERDPDRVRGRWEWSVQSATAGRMERGTFEMYRIVDGRQIAMRYPDFERSVRDGDRSKAWSQPHTITFWKVSKRHVLWEELPF